MQQLVGLFIFPKQLQCQYAFSEVVFAAKI